jgi:hypothetical protein
MKTGDEPTAQDDYISDSLSCSAEVYDHTIFLTMEDAVKSSISDADVGGEATSQVVTLSDEPLLTLAQVSRRLRISEAEVCDLVSYEGLTEADYDGDDLMFRWTDVMDWIMTEIVNRTTPWNDTPTESDAYRYRTE